MNFIGVVCVKNEADIIEAFVRHNLAFLDRLLVLDHGSTDETPAILKALVEEGLNLEISHDDSLGKFQGEKMTVLMHRAAAQGARWVVLLDSDEFIRTSRDRLSLPPADGPGVLKVSHITYGAHSRDDVSERNPVLRQKHRLASEPCQDLTLKERRGHLKALVRGDIALDPETTVMQGNHEVLQGGVEPDYDLWSEWTLAHYSLRSPAQYASKVIINALQKLCRGSVMANHSSFYIRHLELIRSDYQKYEQMFPSLLPAYIEKAGHPNHKVFDPLIYRGGPLRHLPVRSELSGLMDNLVTYSETLARRQGQSPPVVQESGTKLTFLVGFGPDAHALRVEREIGLLVPVKVSFPLPETNSGNDWTMEWRGPIGLVELREMVFTGKDGSALKLPGRQLQEFLEMGGDARLVPHEQYFTFIKEIGPAVMTWKPSGDFCTEAWHALEICFVYDTNPSTIGTRFIQARPLASDVEQRRLIVRLEKKVAELVTVSGFVKHQLEWIWSRILKKL